MKKVQKVIYDKMFIISYFLTMLQQPNIISFAQPMHEFGGWIIFMTDQWQMASVWSLSLQFCMVIYSKILRNYTLRL